MTTYFELFPAEIFYSLSCYLYIPHIEYLCKITRKYKNACISDNLWKFKINHEFPYIPAEYKFSQILTMKHKYIQLKSIRGVDLDSHYFQNLRIYLARASRLKDYNVANELINAIDPSKIIFAGLNANIILTGAIASQNQFLMNKYRGVVKADVDTAYEMIQGFIEAGIYQIPYATINKMLRINIPMRDYDQSVIDFNKNIGLIKRGDLQNLRSGIDLSLFLSLAALAQQWQIVDWLLTKYYNQRLTDRLIQFLFNYLHILIELWENDRLIQTYMKYKNYFDEISIMDRNSLESQCYTSGNIPALKYLYENNIVDRPIQLDQFEIYSVPFAYNQLDIILYMEQYINLDENTAKQILTKFAEFGLYLLPESIRYLESKIDVIK